MVLKLVLASAGSGKSQFIAKQALEKACIGEKILILTYTENNQKELKNKIIRMNGYIPSNILIRGWFTFLLQDMIRPYQRCIYPARIQSIFLNTVDPHKRGGRSIRGRAEKINGAYNPVYFCTEKNKAHTTYLSKLSVRIFEETRGKTTERLSAIYSTIFIDEVQDLVGWDYQIIDSIAKLVGFNFVCVGDFRQTIYSTSITQKGPRTTIEKSLKMKKIGFIPTHLNISWRCIQPICDLADLVHADEDIYPATESMVQEVPPNFQEHVGVFTVSSNAVNEYIKRFCPVILRNNKRTLEGLCEGQIAYNFGESKGLGFNRVLILPTKKQKAFLSGSKNIFNNDKTEKAKNALYVAITRAKYSLAFVFDGPAAIAPAKEWPPG